MRLRGHGLDMKQIIQTGCRRCGSCCRRGGPALHSQDRALVDKGHIPADRLYTIRPGEPVRDNVRDDRLMAASQDIVKIRSRPGGRACIYLDGRTNMCAIYDHRPLECRVLDCRDTAAIEAVYRTQRLSRQDLLGVTAGLWDLVCEHEQRCSAAGIVILAGDWRRDSDGRLSTEQQLLEMVGYDRTLRRLLVEKGRMATGLLDFVFGRSLTVVLRSLGVEVYPMENGVSLGIRAWNRGLRS